MLTTIIVSMYTWLRLVVRWLLDNLRRQFEMARLFIHQDMRPLVHQPTLQQLVVHQQSAMPQPAIAQKVLPPKDIAKVSCNLQSIR